MSPLRRLFFALWPEEPWCSRLIEAAAPVMTAAPGHALARADLHVTLCFLGAVGEAQLAALCIRAGQVEASSFELEFERFEFWCQARIVAATVARLPPAGLRLAQALASVAREVGLTPDLKPWRPHMSVLRGVTLARLPAQRAVDAWPLPSMQLPVARFYLAESQRLGAQGCAASEAARYRRLASWPLRA